MSKAVGFISDEHFHRWSTFSTVTESGLNSRLVDIIKTFETCCDTVLEAGGNTVFTGGDMFHTRGSVSPAVFNPVEAMFKKLCRKGIRIIGIPGNHDLESRDSDALHSSAAMLNSIEGFDIYHKIRVDEELKVVMFPYIEGKTRYIDVMKEWIDNNSSRFNLSEFTAISHIGVDGTISGMTGGNAPSSLFASMGFKRFFSGHYHHFKDFGDGVFSIGATTHQKWGDVGSKAGFVIVKDDKVVHHEAKAPRFISLDKDNIDESTIKDLVRGNFVQIRIGESTNKEVAEARKFLSDLGSLGERVVAIPKTEERRVDTKAANSHKSVQETVIEFCRSKGKSQEVIDRCVRIMSEKKS